MLLLDSLKKTVSTLKNHKYSWGFYLLIFVIMVLLPHPIDLILCGWLALKVRNWARRGIGIESSKQDNSGEGRSR